MVATGFVLEPALLGQEEARGRVLRDWAPGASLRTLPDGRWLLLLAAPASVRAERAPGVVVVSRDGVLVAAGADATAGTTGQLVEVRHGEQMRHDVAALTAVDPAEWIDVGDRTTVTMAPLDAAPAPPAVAPGTAVEAPDLRDLAKVVARSEQARRLLTEGDKQAGVARGSAPRRGRLARVVLRTPVANVVGRRHARYLDRLTHAFETADYDRALRDAIGLGGDFGDGWLTLRLPARRKGTLSPTARRSPGGVVPWGSSAHEHLTLLYRRAAEQLERAGEIERAAFVHADLLHAPRDAVALLERHDRLDLAARLAEGRDLDPDLVVRLWWQTGDRDRAVDLARARGAWAGAIALLQEVRPQSALAMRAAWVAAEQQAGNRLGAVEAAWPEPALQSQVSDDLAALRSGGGPVAGTALGLQLAWREDERWTAEALALLDGRDEPGLAQRRALVTTLSARPAAGAVTDRRLAGQAMRALLPDRDRDRTLTRRASRASFNRLHDRADHMLRADLPAYDPAPPALSVPLLRGHAEPGTLPAKDAVTLPVGVLVATGERGLVLLTHDGRIKARWSVPADRLVVADHGATVLVAGHGEGLDEVHRLDVSSRQVKRWASLPRTPLAQSFDGGILTLVDEGHISGVDTFGDRPRELWRELDPDSRVCDFQRAPDCMSAIVDVPLQGRRVERSIERWTWEFPSRRLRARDLFSDDWQPVADIQITANGTLLWFGEDELGPIEQRRPSQGQTRTVRASDDSRLYVSGEHSAVAVLTDEEVRLTIRSSDHETVAVVAISACSSPGFRVHAGTATVWAPDGRVAAVDLATRTSVANLRVLA